MAERERIFLFDLDGVLIQPGGYRAAVQATLNHFAAKLGAGEQPVDEETISIFEAQGITSEWDMIPFSLAILLNHLAAHQPGISSSRSLSDVLMTAGTGSLQPCQVDYASSIRKLQDYLLPPMAPSEAVLQNLRQRGTQGLYPNLSGLAMLQDLFGNTRDLRSCPTSLVFQNFILGDRLYEKTYGVPAPITVSSYLEQYDRVLLAREIRLQLINQLEAGKLKIAAITARPSMPPLDLPDVANGFSPEAEQALSMVGLDGVPYMGYGSVLYLAQQLNISAELLLKPSPVQALAALLVALGEQPWPALLEAADWAGVISPELSSQKIQLKQNHFQPAAALEIHIFEDSPVGIQATLAASKLLQANGVGVNLSAWGITQNPDKRAALERLGARVFPDVNQVLQHLLA